MLATDTPQLPQFDDSMSVLASYLQSGLNERIQQIYPGVVAVRNTACYNSLPRDLSSFPLLKVYRNVDTFTPTGNTTQAVIGYCQSFPEEERIPGILRWVAKQINFLLREWAIAHKECSPRIEYNEEFRAEYRVMTLNSEPIYSLLQFNFQLMEDNLYE
ncbi:hypothetical protein BZZ01_04890 [Nostocales cyanobacterium HT-58-2]|nr:hypothetical protein BZZ01_04890 [Nostocales cyanobacterium HT-58-2]